MTERTLEPQHIRIGQQTTAGKIAERLQFFPGLKDKANALQALIARRKNEELTAQEQHVVANEISYQEAAYGESPLKAVYQAWQEVARESQFGRELNNPQETTVGSQRAPLSVESPFHFHGHEYGLRYVFSRDDVSSNFLNVKLGIASKEDSMQSLREQKDGLTDFDQGEIAEFHFRVYTWKGDKTRYTSASVNRRSKNGEYPSGFDSAIIFSGAGRSLVMLHDLVIRDLQQRFPVLEDVGEIESQTADIAEDIDSPGRIRTGKTSQIRKQMGYRLVTGNTDSTAAPMWVKRFK